MIKIQLIGLYTLLRKEVWRIFRIWTQTLLPSTITTVLYFLVFGQVIGGRIGEFEGVSYMSFIVPGLIMMAVITNAYSNVSSSVFSAKFQRNIEEMWVSPMLPQMIVLGYIAGGLARGVLIGLLVAGVSLFFSPIMFYHPVFMVLVLILTAAFFSLAGFLNGILARKFDDVSIVPTFVLTPLIYLGGVFYSIRVLPPFWQSMCYFNPVLYLISMFRFGMLGISDVPVALAFVVLLGLVVLLFGICLVVMEKGIGIRS